MENISKGSSCSGINSVFCLCLYCKNISNKYRGKTGIILPTFHIKVSREINLLLGSKVAEHGLIVFGTLRFLQ